MSHPLRALTKKTPDEELLYGVKENVSLSFEDALEAGANPNAKFPDGTSVLEFILRKDLFNSGIHSELYLLLRKGASVEGLNRNDSVRLYHFALRMSIHVPGDHIAVVRRNDKDHPEFGKQVLQRLKAYNLQINSQDTEGNSPLLLAVQTPTESAYFEWLLKNGADANLRNNKNQTALEIFRASARSFREMSAEDGGFDGAAEYHAKNEKLIKKAEEILVKATKAQDDSIGAAVGKVFSVEGKKIEIAGSGIGKLAKGKKIIIKNAAGEVAATVTETLHTKVKAKISGGGSVQTGDPVYLAR